MESGVSTTSKEKLVAAAFKLRAAHEQLQITMLGRDHQRWVRWTTKARVLVDDTVTAAELLSAAYDDAHEMNRRIWDSFEDDEGPRFEKDAFRHAVHAFKGVYFPLAQYQGSLAAALESLMESRPSDAPAKSQVDMEKLLKEGRPVGAWIRQRVSDYPEWFTEWKTMRNALKEGAELGLYFTGPELSVLVEVIPKQVGGSVNRKPVTFQTLVNGLDTTTSLVAAITQEVPPPRPAP
jgi:hypothetical protein